MDVLTVVKAEKWYGNVPGILDADLNVSPGTICVLLGPNGSGKTTLLNMIAGQSRPTKGDIFLYGKPVWRNPTAAKRIVGFVPDADNDLPAFLTGQEYLEFVASVHSLMSSDASVRISDTLVHFDLTSDSKRLINGYSHGMKKKLQIAAALLHHPGLLVIDEPTNGLDPISIRILRESLRELVVDNPAIVLATHDLRFTELLADTICIVYRHRIVARGSLAQLHEQFRCNSLEDIYVTVCRHSGDPSTAARSLTDSSEEWRQ